MNRNLTITLGALLALAGTAMAYGPTSREAISPGTFFHPLTGGVGLATCELVTGPGFAAFCGTGGFGAFFHDIGCSKDGLPASFPSAFAGNGVADNSAGCLDDIDGVSAGCVATDNGNDCDGKDALANGDCSVGSGTTTVSPGGAAWYFLCGTDRDDDAIVTDGDATGSSTTGATAWDDDFVTGDNAQNPVFCFARDRITLSTTDPNAAGDDWDDFVVFVGVNFGNLPAGSVGTLTVTLEAHAGASCTTSNGARSSHDGSGNSSGYVA